MLSEQLQQDVLAAQALEAQLAAATAQILDLQQQLQAERDRRVTFLTAFRPVLVGIRGAVQAVVTLLNDAIGQIDGEIAA